ncbi:rCG37984 [Rattus norvegicus]|uniref:RCG37984 n=1 Tax=Rattus norvegicus TaxID=10116 RepID=A6IV66_RAT|nr:rCG37984 [Rattus norvegicus]
MGTQFSMAVAFQTAKDTSRMSFASNLDLFSVHSISIIILSFSLRYSSMCSASYPPRAL